MQLLEYLASTSDEAVTEALNSGYKARKVFYSEKCKEGKDILKSANDLYDDKKYNDAKKKYAQARNIFEDLEGEVSKVDDIGAAGYVAGAGTVMGTAAVMSKAPGVGLAIFGIVAIVSVIWFNVRDNAISKGLSGCIKAKEHDVDILKKPIDYTDPNYITYKSAIKSAFDDIISYCDAMIKKCSSGR